MGADQLVVDRYRIEREIAHGGMGVILRAYDTRLNRVVALKMLRPDATRDTQLRNRLAAEARTASGLNHPGIATVFDFVEQGEESFIVYEYVAGYTLREELARARFTTAEILNAGVQLVDAVSAAHNHGITHRDLKPENVMFVRENSRRHVKILDFGLAKHGHPPPLGRTLENSSETVSIETVPGLLAGTVSYMAPEQLEGQPTDARTDIFALGLVLYEMVTGDNPFLGRTSTSTIANILKHPAPSVRLRNPATPSELDRILLKCLRKSPEERYQSARELLVDLRNLRREFFESGNMFAPRETEPSLFRRLFSFIGTTPYRWWEVSQIRMVLFHYPIFIYLGWRFMRCTPGGWGLILFFAELACVTALVVLRGVLLFTGAFDRESLLEQLGRMKPWIRATTVILASVVFGMAGILAASHTVLASLLGFFAIVYALAVVWEPVIERAALREIIDVGNEAPGDSGETPASDRRSSPG